MVGFGDLANIMGKVQELQSNMKTVQEELGNLTVEAASGGGMVTVKMNGKFELQELKIDQNAGDVNDVEMLEDLIIAAVNNAVAKCQQTMKEKMTDAMGGLNIPGLDKLGPMLGLGQ